MEKENVFSVISYLEVLIFFWMKMLYELRPNLVAFSSPKCNSDVFCFKMKFTNTCCRFYLKLTSSFLSAELTDNTFPLNSYFISFLKLGKSKSIFCHPFFFHSLENNRKILFHLLELSEVLNLMTQSSIFHIYPYWKKLTITHFIACYTIATILRLSTLSGCQNHVFWTFLKICYA